MKRARDPFPNQTCLYEEMNNQHAKQSKHVVGGFPPVWRATCFSSGQNPKEGTLGTVARSGFIWFFCGFICSSEAMSQPKRSAVRHQARLCVRGVGTLGMSMPPFGSLCWWLTGWVFSRVGVWPKRNLMKLDFQPTQPHAVLEVICYDFWPYWKAFWTWFMFFAGFIVFARLLFGKSWVVGGLGLDVAGFGNPSGNLRSLLVHPSQCVK